tara:strand:- start:49337 stop:49492 length:156 start_codon:yes stop_codon:yes gene_type:complete
VPLEKETVTTILICGLTATLRVHSTARPPYPEKTKRVVLVTVTKRPPILLR